MTLQQRLALTIKIFSCRSRNPCWKVLPQGNPIIWEGSTPEGWFFLKNSWEDVPEKWKWKVKVRCLQIICLFLSRIWFFTSKLANVIRATRRNMLSAKIWINSQNSRLLRRSGKKMHNINNLFIFYRSHSCLNITNKREKESHRYRISLHSWLQNYSRYLWHKFREEAEFVNCNSKNSSVKRFR